MNYSSYYSMPVLVTGGCGFIGSHIAQELVALGAQVTIMDNLSSGSLSNIAHIRSQIHFIQKDITDFSACLQAAEGQHIIFHCAALVSVAQSGDSPLSCHAINIAGTYNMLQAAQQQGAKRFMFSSSAAIYGNCPTICHEQLTPQPLSSYGYSKSIGELLCQQYSQLHGLHTVITRYFNVWGPRQNPHGAYASVIAKFNHCMKHNQPITIYGDGLQTRDYIHVSDVTQANLMLACASIKSGEVINIATGKSISLLELIESLKTQYSHYNAPILQQAERPADIRHSQADISKYKSLLNNYGGKPFIEFSELITSSHLPTIEAL